jgi:iron complex transport system substrate-binding protein
MRIISLLPSATEIVYALGLGDELVGRSHRCDEPEDVVGLPVVTSTRPLADPKDSADRPAAQGGDEVGFEVDLELLAKLEPDLVLASADRGGSPSDGQTVREALRSRGVEATVVGLDPRSLEGIFNSISTVGAFAEAEDEAVGLIELLRERLGALENRILERRLQGIASRRAVVLEWLDPPVVAGRWVPEMVRRAGGWELLGREGDEPEVTSWERLREVAPEILVLALRDCDAATAARRLEAADLPAWFDDLEAVRDGQSFAVESALLLRPGPRAVDAIAVLAELLDPEGFAGAGPAHAWIPLGPLGISGNPDRRVTGDA